MIIHWPPDDSQVLSSESSRSFDHTGTCTTSADNPQQMSYGLQKPPPMNISYLLSDSESNGSPETASASSPQIPPPISQPDKWSKSRNANVKNIAHQHPQMNSYVYSAQRPLYQNHRYGAEVRKRSNSGNLPSHELPNSQPALRDSDRIFGGGRAIEPKTYQGVSSEYDIRWLNQNLEGSYTSGKARSLQAPSNPEERARLNKTHPASVVQPDKLNPNCIPSILNPSSANGKIKLISCKSLCSAFFAEQNPLHVTPVSENRYRNLEISRRELPQGSRKSSSEISSHQLNSSTSLTLSMATECTNDCESLQLMDKVPILNTSHHSDTKAKPKLLRCPVCKKEKTSERSFVLHMKLHSRRFDYLDIPYLEWCERSRKWSNWEQIPRYKSVSILEAEGKQLPKVTKATKVMPVPTSEVGTTVLKKIAPAPTSNTEPMPICKAISSNIELVPRSKFDAIEIPTNNLFPNLKSQYKSQSDLEWNVERGSSLISKMDSRNKSTVGPGRPRMRVKVKRSRGKFLVSLRYKARLIEKKAKPPSQRLIPQIQDTRILYTGFDSKRRETGPYARDIPISNLLT